MHIKAAAVQAEPEWLDLQASIRKTCSIIREAAKEGTHIVAFPELWIPGYPGWIWSRPIDFKLNVEFVNNSLEIKSAEMEEIQNCAAENNIVVCFGFSERYCGSVYIAQCTINSDGVLLMSRRKLKPIHVKRTIFGDGHGPSLQNVVQTPIGRVGALSCAREEIHVSAWPPVMPHPGGSSAYSMSKEAVEAASRLHSKESQAFTLHLTNMISEKRIEKLGTKDGIVFNTTGGRASSIFGPDGRKLTSDLPHMEEGIVYADLEFDDLVKEKAFLDTCGHNSRPDLLWLGAIRSSKSTFDQSEQVRTTELQNWLSVCRSI